MRICGVRRFFLLAVLFGAVLSFPGHSQAHAGAPFWSEKQAREHVLLGPVEVGGRLVRLDDALCVGTGSLRIKSAGIFKYQHFNCLLTPARERRFWIRVHTMKKGDGWDYTFVRWN